MSICRRAEAAGLTWPLGEDWDEDRLETTLFGGPPRPRPAVLVMRLRQLSSSSASVIHNLTQQLLWEGVPAGEPIRMAIAIPRFCGLYQRWRQKQDVVLHARNIRPARSCLSVGQGPPSRCTTRAVVPHGESPFVRRRAWSQFLHLR